MKQKIKVGNIIEWCDEIYEVLEVYPSGDSGKVKYLNGEVVNNFKFNFMGEEPNIIEERSVIKITQTKSNMSSSMENYLGGYKKRGYTIL